ncbi:MAG TPA: hypothetical protein PKD68_03550 [Candidatus Saccharibacteria bacterium]|nr:hypothetical protein [Candidatus Saccharibacteria bacterium]
MSKKFTYLFEARDHKIFPHYDLPWNRIRVVADDGTPIKFDPLPWMAYNGRMGLVKKAIENALKQHDISDGTYYAEVVSWSIFCARAEVRELNMQ